MSVIITDLGNDIQFDFSDVSPAITSVYTLNKINMRLKQDDNNVYITNANGFVQSPDSKIITLKASEVTSPIYADNDALFAGLLGLVSDTHPSVNLVTDALIGEEVDEWFNQGPVSCDGYETVGIWADFTVNNSTGNQLQILYKRDDGSDEYVLETTSDFQKTLGDSDIKIFYPFNVEAASSIIVQTKATDLGITPAYMTGSNNHQPSFATWEAVTDGSFRIVLNGIGYNIDGIDFTGISDLAGVATVARTALRAAVGDDTLGLVYTVPGFIFTANGDLDSSITALLTSTGTVGTDISGFPSANNIWFDAFGSDGVVTPAVVAGLIGTINLDITKA